METTGVSLKEFQKDRKNPVLNPKKQKKLFYVLIKSY